MLVFGFFLAVFLGLAFGNFTTTAFFRIPRGIPLNGHNEFNGKKPHCSTCKHPLKFYEYWPVLSWISSGSSCNYCHAPINPIYTIIEVTVMLLSVLLYFLLGFDESYIMVFLLGMSLVLLTAIEYEHKKVPSIPLFFVAASGLVFRTWLDQSIIPCIQDLLLASLVIYLALRLMLKFHLPINKYFFIMLTISSIWIPINLWWLYCCVSSSIFLSLFIVLMLLKKVSYYRHLSILTLNLSLFIVVTLSQVVTIF